MRGRIIVGIKLLQRRRKSGEGFGTCSKRIGKLNSIEYAVEVFAKAEEEDRTRGIGGDEARLAPR
jgi:hypothetical protein